MNYMDAFEAQLRTMSGLKKLLYYLELPREDVKPFHYIIPGWKEDLKNLSNADTVYWSKDVLAALLDASTSIPDDTSLIAENLETSTMWWYFERPLPVKTTFEDTEMGALGIARYPGFFRLTCYTGSSPKFGIPSLQGTQIPSHIWTWDTQETIQSMCDRLHTEHNHAYGPEGRFSGDEHVPTSEFVGATRIVAKFILAACAWMRQRVVEVSDEHVERHRRKEMVRQGGKNTPTIRVVQLRRREPRSVDAELLDPRKKVEWDHQWIVHGHWRNQPFGPHHSQRRLTFINPYLKGPDDKPFKPGPERLFVVNR